MKPKQKLKLQLKELKSHMHQSGFKHTLPSQQSDAYQKKTQLEEKIRKKN